VRVGFLFNHFFTYRVPHAAPYAFELSRRQRDFEVIVACSSPQEMGWARRIGMLYPGHRCEFRRIWPPWYYRPFDGLICLWKFKRKKRVMRNNLAFFRSLDALVSPEDYSVRERIKWHLDRIPLIHVHHGAGDRRSSVDEISRAFDFTLLPGRKYVDRLKEVDRLRPRCFAAVGYPKFEVARALAPERRRFFDNRNPVVVYNPHWDPRVSSWMPMGLQVLDFFAANPDYNLIFAPHFILFRRHDWHKGRRLSKYRSIPNILIDTGSEASADMTYLRASDIYLGDVSSQVYEFLLEPRPCIHLNSRGVQWQDDPHYSHFKLGQVVNEVKRDLRPALENAFGSHACYAGEQRRAFAHTFHTQPEGSAAQRGADAIAAFLAQSGDRSVGTE